MDGVVDCDMQEPWPYYERRKNKDYYLKKEKGAGVRYESGICRHPYRGFSVGE
jgi:hypothetical protein